MRSPLQRWLDRQACRRWERGPARRPRPEELAELHARLREVNIPKQREPGPEPFVDEVREFVDRMHRERAEREERVNLGRSSDSSWRTGHQR